MKENIAKLDTERRNKDTMNLDQLSTVEVLEKINKEDQKVAVAVSKELDSISELIDEASAQYQAGGRIVYIGAGTSGRMGVLDASECPPTFGVDAEDFTALIAGGSGAILKAVEGAEDSKELAVEDLKQINLTSADYVVGIAASGRTPYVIGGLEYANSIGAKTGSVAAAKNSEIGKISNNPVEVFVGPEAITGSTRMKAGTAQKLVLNMISSTIMIKAGKVYENLMVDVSTTNKKLVNRATRIISEAVNTDFDHAATILEESSMDVKIAILKGVSGCETKECQVMLDKNNGNIAKTIRTLKEK